MNINEIIKCNASWHSRVGSHNIELKKKRKEEDYNITFELTQ